MRHNHPRDTSSQSSKRLQPYPLVVTAGAAQPFQGEFDRLEEMRAAERSIKKFPAGTDEQNLLWLGKLRITKPRLRLAEFLFKSKEPLSIADIHERLGSKIGQATLYRMLEQLVARGLVIEIKQLGAMHSLFELAYGRKHHHHAICTSCGDIEDLSGCDAADLNASARAHLKKFKSIQSHSLEFFGLCRKCEGAVGPRSDLGIQKRSDLVLPP